jgi:hypothetical protein
MKKITTSVFFIFVLNLVFSQDTVTVQTFTWDSNSRRAVFQFPDDPNQSYRKILMSYNMRCHGARVGVSGVGCGEWDYSCNTFITDSSRVDSNQSSIGSYVISGFNGLQFYYTTLPASTYYRLIQKNAKYTSVVSEQKRKIGNGNTSLSLENTSGGFRSQYLFTAQELMTAGLSPGPVTGLDLSVAVAGNELQHLRVRMKSVAYNTLATASPETDGFTEVYFKDTDFNLAGIHRLQFYTPFQWNGSSSIVVEFSYTDYSPVNPLQFFFHDTGTDQFAIAADANERSIVWDGVNAKTSGGKLNSISEQITVSFWAYGTSFKQPSDGSILEGLDQNGQRSLNIHLPWSNGGIYFDCGFQNGGYDRIEKTATVADYEAQWVHWAFTKNATTSEMHIYRNGKLWQSGFAKFKPIQISELTIGTAANSTIPYYGRMRELSIWNKALDSITINAWKHKSLDASHPLYANLIYYYPLNDNDGKDIHDASPNPTDLQLPVDLKRNDERGDKMLLNFKSTVNRPNVSFVQGVYAGTSVENINVIDSVPVGPRRMVQYKIVNNALIVDSIFYVYAALYDKLYLENGDVVGEVFIEPEGELSVSTLKYFIKTPAKYELISLVTPYGNNLDLGKDGKTFVFDVTDFTPILKGKKLISMELGGEGQEEIDLKFIFIKGIPEREVLDVSNVWPFQRGYFSEILSNSRFESRKLKLHPDASNHKLRFSITGHEQNGEFTPRGHFVTVNGNSIRKFPFTVWKECAWNPIYPQGGTWIFDRAGWCPGAPTELNTFDISNLIPASKEITIDYGLEPPQMDQANYLVSSQLVSYGQYKHSLDVAIEEIMRPSTGRVEFDRLNPSCNKPMIVIRNAGSETLTSVKIRYGIKNGIKEDANWTGNLLPSQTTTVELPVSQKDFWVPGPDSLYVFEVELSNPNDGVDVHAANNKMETKFKKVDSYSVNLFFEFKTNSIPEDNDYKIVDNKGTVVLQRSGMSPNTVYRDELLLPPGCYTLYVNDVSHDGLYFWFFANLGNGSARMMRKVNNVLIPLRGFNSDFGAGFQYDFVVAEPVGVNEPISPTLLSISPNPATDEVNIEYETTETGKAELIIKNEEGKIVFKDQLQASDGMHSLKWNVQNLSSGIYFVQITQKQRTITRKLVKM